MTHSSTAGHPRARLRLGAIALAGALAITGVITTPAYAATESVAAKGSDKARDKATPDIAALAGAELASQKLEWAACPAADEARLQPYVDLAKCTDVKVPVDWFNPTGEYWTIKVSHVVNSAVGSAGHKGTIFVNPGGPGGSGLIWGGVMHVRTPELNSSYNYVGFDPRGVGLSSAPDECLLPEGVTDESVGEHCSLQPENKAISTKQTAFDMDFIRHLLGEEKLSYIGYSYGTWLGSIYAREFPANTGPMLLDSSTDITGPNLEQTWYMQNIARDRQFSERMIPWVARNGAQFGLPNDPDEIERRYFAAWEKVNAGEIPLGILYWLEGLKAFSDNSYYPLAGAAISAVIEAGEAPEAPADPVALATALVRAAGTSGTLDTFTDGSFTTSVDRLIEENTRKTYRTSEDYPDADLSNPDFDPCRSEGWLAWDWTDFDDSTVDWRSCTGTYWDDFWPLLEEYPDELTPEKIIEVVLGLRDALLSLRDVNPLMPGPHWYDAFENIRCNDGQWDTDVSKWSDPAYQAKIPFSATLGAGTAPLCALWTASDTVTKLSASTFPGAFVVQAEMDSQTAYETGLTSGTKAPKTVFTAVDNMGDHGLFPMGTECVDRPVLDYFLTGALPQKKVRICDALPLPWEDQVFETWNVLGPNGKPKAAKSAPVTAAVQQANDVARELLAEQDVALTLSSMLAAR